MALREAKSGVLVVEFQGRPPAIDMEASVISVLPTLRRPNASRWRGSPQHECQVSETASSNRSDRTRSIARLNKNIVCRDVWRLERVEQCRSFCADWMYGRTRLLARRPLLCLPWLRRDLTQLAMIPESQHSLGSVAHAASEEHGNGERQEVECRKAEHKLLLQQFRRALQEIDSVSDSLPARRAFRPSASKKIVQARRQ